MGTTLMILSEAAPVAEEEEIRSDKATRSAVDNSSSSNRAEEDSLVEGSPVVEDSRGVGGGMVERVVVYDLRTDGMELYHDHDRDRV
jgi:hypothetical protein